MRLEQSEEGERWVMQSQWQKRLLRNNPDKGPRAWPTLTGRGWGESIVHPFEVEESNSALGQ